MSSRGGKFSNLEGKLNIPTPLRLVLLFRKQCATLQIDHILITTGLVDYLMFVRNPTALAVSF